MMEFYAGKKCGELSLQKRVRATKNLNANCKKRWLCICSCGKEIVVPEYYLRRPGNPKTHCGCKSKTIQTIYYQEHRIWYMMHVRTENPEHEAYHHYGGRGIKVCKEWNKGTLVYDKETKKMVQQGIEGFKAFLAHIGERPSMDFSVDRINVDGNYAPGNVRWATRKEQAANKRPKKSKGEK